MSVVADSAIAEDATGTGESVAAPVRKPTRSLARYAALGVLAALLAASYYEALAVLVIRWSKEADYSHGFFVPLFSLFLLWHRRRLLPASPVGSWWGAALLAAAGVIRCAATFFAFSLVEPFTIPLSLAGVTLLLGGWGALRYAWPAIVFLFFMVPLPGFLSTSLSGPLQRIATISSVYLLQTVGVSAISQGNVIRLSAGEIGVVEACSGLRMLTLFFAICFGACFLIRKPLWEKAVIVASAVVIGVVANILRITATGIVYETAGEELAERIFHDFAGWLLMPTAILMLGLELLVLSKLFIDARSGDVLRLNVDEKASA